VLRAAAKQFVFMSCFLLLISGTFRSELIIEIMSSGVYDTNAEALRLGQFKNSGSADYYGSTGLKIQSNDIIFEFPYSMYYSFDYRDFVAFKDQGARKHILDLDLETELQKEIRLIPRFNLEYYDENTKEWSYFKLKPSVYINYLDADGLLLELNYGWESRQFLDKSLRNTYQNISSNTHSIDSDVKIWLNTYLRTMIKYSMKYESFEGAGSFSLSVYSGIPQGAGRKDITHAVGLEELVLLNKIILLNFMYEYKYNNSDSGRYAYRANRFGMDIYYEVIKGHTMYAMGGLTFFEYFNNNYDVRYLNTKEDYYTDFSLGYVYEFTGEITAELRYNYTSNDSNDALDFNAAFSKSYSNYTRSNLALLLKFGFSII